MTNVEFLFEHEALVQFTMDSVKMNEKAFREKYGIPEKMLYSEWLTKEREEPSPYEVEANWYYGMRVYKIFECNNGERIELLGTVRQVISDSKGLHVLVEWDDVDSFKTMETPGKDVFKV